MARLAGRAPPGCGAGAVETPCSWGGRGECEEVCVDSSGRGGGHSLLLLGGLGKEEGAGAGT